MALIHRIRCMREVVLAGGIQGVYMMERREYKEVRIHN